MYKWLMYPDDEVNRYAHRIHQAIEGILAAIILYMFIFLPRC